MTDEQRIAAFASGPVALPDSARQATVRLLGDTLRVGAAGAASEPASALAALAAPGPCRLLGGGQASATDAAFANGFAIHCLEWDAVHEGAVVHALSVVTATLLAVADRLGGVAPERMVEAAAVGIEVAAGLGLAATGPMRFFRPATAGVIGAALAAGRLAQLPAERFEPLIGLAYSLAGGTMQAHVEGSVALALQVAAAARSAVTALDATLARLDGPRHAISGPFGYAALIEPLDLDPWLAGLGTRWLVEEVSIKPWPSGRASHGALGALADALADDIDPGEIATIRLDAPPLIVRLIGRPWQDDMSAAWARLCLPYLAVIMLRDRRIDPRRFTPQDFADKALRRTGDGVSVVPSGETDPNIMVPQTLTLILRDGSERVIHIAAIAGSPAALLSPAAATDREVLLREIAGPAADPRLFDDPLPFACEPR